MDQLPEDPAILFSFLNMKLRDNYMTLDQLCDDLDIDRAELERKMLEYGWEYNPSANKFW